MGVRGRGHREPETGLPPLSGGRGPRGGGLGGQAKDVDGVHRGGGVVVLCGGHSVGVSARDGIIHVLVQEMLEHGGGAESIHCLTVIKQTVGPVPNGNNLVATEMYINTRDVSECDPYVCGGLWNHSKALHGLLRIRSGGLNQRHVQFVDGHHWGPGLMQNLTDLGQGAGVVELPLVLGQEHGVGVHC